MKPDFAPLREQLREYDVDESSAKPVTEGVWFAWRTASHATIDITNAVWWTHDGSHIVSLAQGTGLHGWGGMDYETYSFKPTDSPEDICCHESFAAAEACALGAIRSGKWCGGDYWPDEDAS